MIKHCDFRGEERKFNEKLKEIQQLAHKNSVCSLIKNTVDTERKPNRVLQLTHMWECRSKAQSEQLEKKGDKLFPSPSVMTMLSVPKLLVFFCVVNIYIHKYTKCVWEIKSFIKDYLTVLKFI